VTVYGDDRVTVDPPRSHTGPALFRSHRLEGHLYVVPAEAELLVAGGQLDRRLFDVTELLELRYDDASRDDLPLIVTYQRSGPGSAAASARSAAIASLAAAGAQVTRSLDSVGAAAIRAPKRDTAAVWSALAGPSAAGLKRHAAISGGIAKVWLDGMRKPVLDRSAVQIGAPTAWAAGLTGSGVTVAVLDTGIDADHPDFAGRIADSRNFVEDGPADDDVGHGTHVASILAGSGAAEEGRYTGIAPDATLLVGKVCDLFGCPESSIIAGMEWAAESGAVVVNLSLGGRDLPEIDPLEESINTLTAAHGTLFVAAAGNFPGCGGPDRLQVSSPSTADAALSVGAVDSTDAIADFSCRGPRVGDGAVKPEVSAPGVDIVAGRARGTPLGDFEPVSDFYTRMSGTSMATPHVAGAAAILAQAHPEWRAAELKAALMASARPTAAQGVLGEGAGRVDVARAITQSVLSSPVSLNFGTSLWPHDDDEPVTRAVTYQNRGDRPITLELSVEDRDPDGGSAAGMFSVSPAAITVPVGGEASATIIADTRVAGPDGAFSGVVVATGGDQSVRTPFSLTKEFESYDLTLEVVDRDGSPATLSPFILDLDHGGFVLPPPATSPFSLRLRRASYSVGSAFFGAEANGREYGVMLVQPRLELAGPTTLVMDGRVARPVVVSVPIASARRAHEVFEYNVQTEAQLGGSAIAHSGLFDEEELFDFLYTAQVGPSVAEEEFFTLLTATWAEPGSVPGRRFLNSPYVFNAVIVAARGGLATGIERDLEMAEFATVENEYAQSTPALDGLTSDFGFPRSVTVFGAWGITTGFDLPGRRTAHYLAEDVDWRPTFDEADPDTFASATFFTPGPFTLELEAGETTRDAWNQAVLGPRLSFPGTNVLFAARFGDEIEVAPSYYSDRGDHDGFSATNTGSIRLLRNGEVIGETSDPNFGFFSVPPEAAEYRLELESNRGGLSPLSSLVQIDWTFRSQTPAPGDDFDPLPLLAVRFLPRLDERNAAPAGSVFVIPFEVSRQARLEPSPIDRLSVEVSQDSGASWHRPLVVRFGDRGFVLIRHRRGEGTVSLRASARDRDGNRVEQTILDAYHVRDRHHRITPAR
jgi:subtilisin family serine protease